jgi:hypothetical protein
MGTWTFPVFRDDQSPPQYFPNCGGATRHPILKSKFVNGGEVVR